MVLMRLDLRSVFYALAIVFSVSSSINCSYAQDAKLREVFTQIPKAERIRGQFTQTRQLREMPFPIVSSGNFRFDGEAGLRWNTLHPIASEVHINDRYLLQFENGREVLRLDVESNPILGLIGTIFISILTGSEDELTELFTIHASSAVVEGEEQWKLVLLPKRDILKNFSEKIEVRGRHEIEYLTMLDSSGDLTTVKFHSIVSDTK